MALRDQPYLPLYVQDYMTDEKLAECSATANGVFIRIMCVMHKSEPYGKILLKQRDKQSTQQIENFAIKLAKHMPFHLNEIISSVKELTDEGVLIIEGDYLVQKRMVIDFELSEKRAKAGRRGVFAKAKPKANGQANSIANSEYENEYENKENNDEDFNDANPNTYTIPPSYTSGLRHNPPPFEDVHALFVRNGKTEAEARTFYNHFDGLGWMKGITPIINWTAFANNWIANPITTAKQQQPAAGVKSFAAQVIANKQQNGQS